MPIALNAIMPSVHLQIPTHTHIMKNKPTYQVPIRSLSSLIAGCVVLMLAVLAGIQPARAAVIVKANNTANLNLGTSWVGGVVPGAGDVAAWDSTVTGANATSLGASTNWLGIKILNPGGLVQINADGNTLTNGTAGIDMSAASQSLTLNNNVALNSGPQNWTVASGQTLTLDGNFTRRTGSGLRFYLPDISASSAFVTTTNGTPNWLLGGTTNSTFGNIYFATINDIDLAALNGSMQVVGGSTISGLYSVNTVGGQNPTDNTSHNVANFGGSGSAAGVGWRFSGTVTWGAAYLDTPQTYLGTGAILQWAACLAHHSYQRT